VSAARLAVAATLRDSGFVLACVVCELNGGPFASQAEAGMLAAIHDGLHHAGQPTAAINANAAGQSCQLRPVVAIWPVHLLSRRVAA
jgi:hypothetical protein